MGFFLGLVRGIAWRDRLDSQVCRDFETPTHRDRTAMNGAPGTNPCLRSETWGTRFRGSF